MIKLIEISGDSCANCHALMPQLSAIARDNNLEFERIDIETCPAAIEKYAIDRIPSVIIADGDEIIAKCSGYQPQEILELWVAAKIEDYVK